MWNILPNEDETMIADAVRQFLAAELPLDRLRPKAKGVDGQALRQGMGELGWFAVGLAEEAGGSGLGLVEEMLIQREFGRHVASPGLLAMVLAGHVHAAAGQPDLAAEVTSGARDVGLVLLPSGGSGAQPALAFDWNEGDDLLVWNDQGMGICPAVAFAQAVAEDCVDDSVTLHAGVLDLAQPKAWVDRQTLDLVARARVLLAAGLVGLADGACDLTVDYAKIREQFGKPIGSFQAVKHRCADMGVRTRLAWYQTNVACLKVMAGAGDAGLQVDSALLLASEAAHENARAGVQLHGGIGFQAECDVHWFAKRTHVYDQLVGGRTALSRQVLAFEAA